MTHPSAENSLANLRVAAFESRRADALAEMIQQQGGIACVTAALREVSPQQNPAAVDFANRVITGQIDAVVFTTGTGVRRLVEQVERHVDRARFLTAISDVVTVARGPKPAAALEELGIKPTHRTAPPHTWREILQSIDRHLPLANHTVGLQEYGEPNASLLAGLEARGATVVNLRLYHWDLPADTAALAANLQQIAAGKIDVVLFTSSHQVVNVLNLAERLAIAERFRQGLRGAVVASIGPDTTAMLRQNDLLADLEADQPTMQQLLADTVGHAGGLLAKKRWLTQAATSTVTAEATSAPSAQAAAESKAQRGSIAEIKPAALDRNDPCYDSLFLKACRSEPVSHTPVWLMRQAGRYMPEYRAVREKVGFLELCKNPALCAEVMVTAVKRLGVDAAIIFSDLLPILEPMGLDLEFSAGEGPVIHNPVREARDVDRVLELESVESLSFVIETVRQTRSALPRGIPVIGFAGAPFTLASYVIEGGASRNFLHTKTLMYRDSGAWNVLMSRLSRAIARYLNAQIAAGAHAVQLFDSWVGCLGTDDYRRYVLPHLKTVIAALPAGVPILNFATGNPALLPLLAEAGVEQGGRRKGEGGKQEAGGRGQETGGRGQETGHGGQGAEVESKQHSPFPIPHSPLESPVAPQSALHPFSPSPFHPPIVGIDWRIRLDDAWRAIGYDRAVQGNLDPAVLFADRAEIRRRAHEVLTQAAGRPGHIFNLGHGILPQTPVDNAIALVDAVHELSARKA